MLQTTKSWVKKEAKKKVTTKKIERCDKQTKMQHGNIGWRATCNKKDAMKKSTFKGYNRTDISDLNLSSRRFQERRPSGILILFCRTTINMTGWIEFAFFGLRCINPLKHNASKLAWSWFLRRRTKIEQPADPIPPWLVSPISPA